MIQRNTPLGVNIDHDDETGETIISWSYIEDADIDYFELEVWDPRKRRWVPYDGRYGIVSKD